MKQDVILNGHQVAFLICFILAIQIQAQELPNFSNLTDLSKLFTGNQTFLSELSARIQEQCPQLYANSQEPENLQKSDFLILELPKSCPTDSTSYILCFVALQSSNNLCNMSHTIKLRDKDHQLPEPTNTNATSESICKSFEDPTMVSNLTLYINKYLQTKIPASYFFSQGCNQLCKGNNTNLCAIILFNFKTMMQWDPDYNQEQQSLPIPTEISTQHATKIAATELSQLFTTANISKLSSSTKSMTTTSVKTTPTASTKTDVTITSAHVTQKAKSKHTGATKQPKAKTEHSKKIHPPIEKTYEGEQELPQENLEDSVMEGKYPADDNDALLGLESNEEKTVTKASIQAESHSHDSDRYFEQPEDTHFLFYFISFATLSACGYVIYIKRKRIIALIIEGRGQPSSSRRRSSSSRERSGGYRKLVNNLEEVITSSQAVKHTNVIY